MLVIPEQAQGHFISVMRQATERGLLHKLLAKLQYLNTYGDPECCGKARVMLGYDGADMSFSVTWKHPYGEADGERVWRVWMRGGLVFHPDYSGGAPTGGGDWSVHT